FLVSDDAPTGFEPGDHASTFGGNLVTSAAACAVLDTIDDELLAHVKEISKLFVDAFAARGLGLLLAFDTPQPAGEIVEAALERGLVIGSAGPNTIRLTPPLTLTVDEARQGIALLKELL
ncbi:MAG TPA: aminotransferase class III-fold pyridoxal phosphate-dependent enzyme, partial [Gaiellaceae bacterium]|nr:aminotransferase class III-fold pyridoxal phosphate-dependent enzyme [Gaiellaceae bacterium]